MPKSLEDQTRHDGITLCFLWVNSDKLTATDYQIDIRL